MSIQQGVNQLLGMSAAAFRLSPKFEENAELKGIDRKIRALDKTGKAETKKYGYKALNVATSEEALDVPYATHSARAERAVKRAGLVSQLADIRPSTRNVINARRAKTMAMEQLHSKLEAQLIQKQEFNDLMKRLQGGKDEQK